MKTCQHQAWWPLGLMMDVRSWLTQPRLLWGRGQKVGRSKKLMENTQSDIVLVICFLFLHLFASSIYHDQLTLDRTVLRDSKIIGWIHSSIHCKIPWKVYSMFIEQFMHCLLNIACNVHWTVHAMFTEEYMQCSVVRNEKFQISVNIDNIENPTQPQNIAFSAVPRRATNKETESTWW